MKSMVDIIFCQSTPFKVEDILIYPTRRLKLRQNNLHTILDVEDTSRERERERGAYIVDVGGPHFQCTWIRSNPLKGRGGGKPCLVHETLKFCIQTKFFKIESFFEKLLEKEKCPLD
jgi:hypothetical protein